MEDQVIRLILETLGTSGLTKLRTEAEGTKGKLADLAGEYARGAITADELDKQSRALGASHARQTALLSQLETAQAKATDEQARASAVGAKLLDALQGLSREEMEAAQAAQRLAREQEAAALAAQRMARQQEAVDATTVRASGSMRTLGDEAKHASGGVAGFGQTALQTGRIVQDFAQGGIGGILNNIEGITVALGLGSGLAGVLTIVGVGFALAGPKILDWAKKLADGSNAIPPATDRLKDLDNQLAAHAKRLDELKEKQSITNTELEEFNQLTAESTRLEKEKDEEAQRKADLTKLRGLKAEGAESPDRAKALQTAVGNAPSVDTLTAGIQQAMVDSARKERDAINKQLGPIVRRLDEARREGRPVDPKDEAEYQKRAPRRDELSDLINDAELARQKAVDLARAALERGDRSATEQIAAMMKERPSLFPTGQVAGFGAQTEAGQAALEQARARLTAVIQGLASDFKEAAAAARVRRADQERRAEPPPGFVGPPVPPELARERPGPERAREARDRQTLAEAERRERANREWLERRHKEEQEQQKAQAQGGGMPAPEPAQAPPPAEGEGFRSIPAEGGGAIPSAPAAGPVVAPAKGATPQWAIDAADQRDENEAKLRRSPTTEGRVARAKARREAKAAAQARRKAAAQAGRDRRGRGASGTAADYQAAREATGGGSVSGRRSGPDPVDREFQGINTRDMLSTALGGSESERAVARIKATPRQPSAAERGLAEAKAKEQVTPADAGQAQAQAPPPVPAHPVAPTPAPRSAEADWVNQREAWLKARENANGRAQQNPAPAPAAAANGTGQAADGAGQVARVMMDVQKNQAEANGHMAALAQQVAMLQAAALQVRSGLQKVGDIVSQNTNRTSTMLSRTR